MPKKSGQDRRRRHSRSKRKELRSPGVQQQATQTPVVATHPHKVSIPQPASKIKQAVIEQRYVVGELKRIGILTGIMLVILVVLAVVLS